MHRNATQRSAPRRAVGIVRVSQTKGREGESFASPAEQLDRIRMACERDGLKLVDWHDELDVSGGLSLDRREGLLGAVEAVEQGRADVVAAAYFDRLFRSLSTQAEVIARVERAGGQVLAVDVGQVTNGSAGQWLSGTMLGAVSEYQRRTTAERSAEAQRRAVARGVAPYPNVPPGYLRGTDGVLTPDPQTAPVVTEAFRLRASGATVQDVRDYLADHGIDRSYHGTIALLHSRVVLGELHFGELCNLSAHPPIVERDAWQAVQRVSVPRGRRAKSERLLARLGVLRCASCGARMVVGTANRSDYRTYRCPATGDCLHHVSISAGLVEGVAVDATKRALSNVEGRATAEQNARVAAEEAERAQRELDGALHAFQAADVIDEQGAVDRLAELRAVRDECRDRAHELGAQRSVISVSAARDWDRLTLEEQRGLIRSVVESITVAPGRGPDRLTIRLFGE